MNTIFWDIENTPAKALEQFIPLYFENLNLFFESELEIVIPRTFPKEQASKTVKFTNETCISYIKKFNVKIYYYDLGQPQKDKADAFIINTIYNENYHQKHTFLCTRDNKLKEELSSKARMIDVEHKHGVYHFCVKALNKKQRLN